MGVSEKSGEEAIAALPYVDEHAAEVAASAQSTWEALLVVAEGSFAGGAAPRVARALGCADTASSGPRPLAVGATIPGFHVAVADPGSELALVGNHRFSAYALVFHLDRPQPQRTRIRAETRAEFPGLKGGAYRAMVIGTRGHVLVTRRLLAAVKARAERST
jgi:hypothetical protein